MSMRADTHYMREALGLARRGLGRTSPNPAVGAVVVRDGQVVGRGFHRRAGEAHAEVVALQEAGSRARGATLYVTLEPCPTTGRTGPCTEAILQAGIARVVVAARDPDPHVDGRGLQRLGAAGVEVTTGVLAREAVRLLEAYIVHRRTGRPFVTLKWAMSLDGKISARRDRRTMISGERSLRYDHVLRNVHDAVLVGIGTVLADDPRLTCRIPGGRDPLRVILDSRLRISLESRLLHLRSAAPTLVVAGERAPRERVEVLRAAGAEVLILPGERPALRDLMGILAGRGILSVLVEGGGMVHAAALAEEVVHKVVAIVGPGLIGGAEAPTPVDGAGRPWGDDMLRLADVTVRRRGEDVVIEGYLPAAGAMLEAEVAGASSQAAVG
ncbi:MAG: bifunctional diaminohydroxyphosphoribosylaminopyrimidine deaminase/5-amino-6-(5-phosphoribosylamino)uracil reductase RibD [Armatimonadota bacterium]|nr:bifunctional diaminohydroxyphosphoribosylaminopyrimidine deaminase/5-amino-6-(5-phosphoribosylamino)uracil reductase RibD [Armatimonadota bacterium]